MLTRRRPRSRLLASLRVMLLLLVCSAVCLVALLRATRARAGDVLVSLGQQLMQLPDAHYGGGVRELWVNGLALKVQSGTSKHAPEHVVTQFTAACKASAAIQLDERERGEMDALPESGWLDGALDGVLVEENEGGTAVVCIDAMGKPWDALNVAAAAERFTKSGDLLDLGRLRYAWVRPVEQGSIFLTFWTEGSTRLLEQFPPDRDAPGFDFPEVQRVSGSQRYLSARLSDSLMTIYQHRDSTAEQVSERYRAALATAGYQPLNYFARNEGHFTHQFEKGKRHVLLSVTAREGQAMATLLSQP